MNPVHRPRQKRASARLQRWRPMIMTIWRLRDVITTPRAPTIRRLLRVRVRAFKYRDEHFIVRLVLKCAARIAMK